MVQSELINKPIHDKSVSHIITARVPTTSLRKTARNVKKELTSTKNTYDSINYVYVLDHNNHLKGVLSLKELLALPDDTAIEEAMKSDIVFIRPHTHQERAVHMALKHNIKAVPVIDKDEQFIGVVSSDTILKLANDEVTEDLMLLEGIYSKDYAAISTIHNSSFHLLKKRIPWLLVGLAGGLFAAQVIGFFEGLLEQEVLLVGFLPLMVYMSDAVGSQSQTLFIRYAALNNDLNFWEYLRKEMIIGVLMAFVLAVVLSSVSSLLYHPFFGMVIGISMFCAIVLSVFIAILIPWILIRLHKDPAIGSGPFATVLRDILSIMVYFGVSHFLYQLR